MIKVEIDRQLMIRAKNETGKLSQITNLLSANNINIIAICAYSLEGAFALMFVTEDNNAAKSLLESKHYKVEEEEVILLTMENKPGALQRVTDQIACAGIDLSLLYGSVDGSSDLGKVVLISRNNYDAVLVIKTLIERA
jgi:hypothetical protein